jgi:hypothetical protein
MLIQPSQADVRRFFCSVYAKALSGPAAGGYRDHSQPVDCRAPRIPRRAGGRGRGAAQHGGTPEEGKTNPFLHLSMHLSISEQCSIDQPRGIRQAVELLTHRRNSLHEAHHDTMECLGRMIWESQRAGRAPDGDAYIDCVQRRATRD